MTNDEFGELQGKVFDLERKLYRVPERLIKLEDRADDAKAMFCGRCEDRTEFDRLQQRVRRLESDSHPSSWPQHTRQRRPLCCSTCGQELHWKGV